MYLQPRVLLKALGFRGSHRWCRAQHVTAPETVSSQIIRTVRGILMKWCCVLWRCLESTGYYFCYFLKERDLKSHLKKIQGSSQLWAHHMIHSWASFPVWEVWQFLLRSHSEQQSSQVGSPCCALKYKCENRFNSICCCVFSFTTGKACLDGKISFAMLSAFESG